MIDINKTSKTLSYILRHKPENFNVILDKNGYALVSNILDVLELTLPELKEIVNSDTKKRYSFSDDFFKIRANQGHSIKVDLNLKKIVPPIILYHGTNISAIQKIKKEGLKKMNRHHVHLTDNINTAKATGGRRGSPIILQIDCKEMLKDKINFYLSENFVYLVDEVPTKYILWNATL